MESRIIGEKRFWEILEAYPEVLRVVEELGYGFTEEDGEYIRSTGAGWFRFKTEEELRAILADWIIDEEESSDPLDDEIEEVNEEEPMILYCRKCGHTWLYSGEAEIETSCPRCKSYVNLNQVVNQSLPESGDYSGAEYIGVTNDGTLVYYDSFYGLLVEFVGPSDPYTRSEEEKCPNLVEAVKDIAYNIGWKYRISNKELETL